MDDSNFCETESHVFLLPIHHLLVIFTILEISFEQIAVAVMDEQGRVELMNPHIQSMEVKHKILKSNVTICDNLH